MWKSSIGSSKDLTEATRSKFATDQVAAHEASALKLVLIDYCRALRLALWRVHYKTALFYL